MSEYPILFNGEMVRAILDGRKTQTRRPVTNCKPFHPCDDGIDVLWACGGLSCPYGQPGDRLYVRETWQEITPEPDGETKIIYRADGWLDNYWSPSIFMPKKHARIWLTVNRVWVERVQDISEADAWQDGGFKIPNREAGESYRSMFATLWDSIFAAKGYGWDVNPWVFACEFSLPTE